MGVEVRAGHFQFLDSAGLLQRAVCLEGSAADAQVREVAQALMVAHAETRAPRRPQGTRAEADARDAGADVGRGGVRGGDERRGGARWIVLRDGGGREDGDGEDEDSEVAVDSEG